MKIKRMFTSIIVSIFATLSIANTTAVFADEEESDNTIIYSDFDDKNMGKWTSFGGGMLSFDEVNAHSGDTSIKISDRPASYCGPSLTCDDIFIAGETYKFDSWVYHESDSAKSLSWTIKYRDAYGTENYAQIAGADIEPGVWTQLSNTIAMNEDAVGFFIYFECTDETVDFNVDDIVVTGNGLSQKDKDDIEYLDEYNMDLEEDFEQWVSRGDVIITHTDEYCKSGSYSIFASNRNKTWNGPTTFISDKVKKGESYYYSAYIMYTGDEYENSHKFRMELQYTIAGTETYNLITEKEIEKGKWTKIDGYYTVPEEAENIMLYIQTSNVDEDVELTNNDLMSFYIDDVKIAKEAFVKKQRTVRIVVIAVSVIVLLAVLLFIVRFIFKRVKKNSEALELVSLDAMTRVYNRNSYEKKIGELKKDTEKCKKLYFALCDVNFLKYINDNHGHKAGDEAIIRCAKLLSKIVEKTGEVYRTGGDEFVCISSQPLKDAVLHAAEAESKIDNGYPFKVACGFAQYDSKLYPDVTAIIAQCDKEMYIHKQKIKAENEDFSRK